MRILMADRDTPLCQSLKSNFAQHGHLLEIAENGTESLSKLKDFVPDVLVIEGMLPPNGCEDVLSSMWDDPSLSHVPAVILMAASEKKFDGLRNRNAVAWLQKPFEPDDLLQKVQAAAQSTSAPASQKKSAIQP